GWPARRLPCSRARALERARTDSPRCSQLRESRRTDTACGMPGPHTSLRRPTRKRLSRLRSPRHAKRERASQTAAVAQIGDIGGATPDLKVSLARAVA